MFNTMKTFALMAGLSVLLVLIGGAFFGEQGALLFFLGSLAINLGSFWFSDTIVLRSYRARVVSEAEAPRLVSTVARLAQRADLPMPRVAVIPQQAPNAFATGRGPGSAVVAVTEGLLSMLNQDELEGVLAHELGHVKNRDILLSTIAASMVGAITMISRWGFYLGGSRERGVNPIVGLAVMILAPIGAMLLQMSVSRSREFGADKAGAEISGKPLALASALTKLERFAQSRPTDVNPATSHLFIVNPLGGLSGVTKLFRTHPATGDRVTALQRLAQQMGQA